MIQWYNLSSALAIIKCKLGCELFNLPFLLWLSVYLNDGQILLREIFFISNKLIQQDLNVKYVNLVGY